jgi:hypothetical protein
MKKIVVFSSLLLTLISCSPEAMTNKKIAGMWYLVSIDGKSLDSDYKEQLDFAPDGRGGTITETKTTNGIPVVTYGKYALIKSGSITISRTKSDGGYDDQGYDFSSITDNSLTMTQNMNGHKVYVYKK